MSAIVEYKVRDGVALITVNNPPINALSQPVRTALRGHVEAAEADPEVGAIVIQAEGRTFPAGADLRDFHARIEPPTLGDVARTVEDCTKPVIAAIHGTALGGGLELALACHYRIAHIDAQLGLPDVALGAVPAAGASQRLPRIVGVKAALDLLITARPISTIGAERIGLVDKVIKKNLRRAALGSARNFIGAGIAARPTRARREGMSNPRAYLEAVKDRRESTAQDRREAVHKAIDLVEAALLLPFEAGLEVERATFEDLVESDQARGLRHAFLAERRTTHGAALAPSHARPHDRIGVVGAGPLAVDILRAAMKTGQRLVWHDDNTQALDTAMGRIEAALERAVERGTITSAGRDAQLAHLSAVPDPEPLAECDVVIEGMQAAKPDELRTMYERLGSMARPGTVFASATTAGPGGLEARAQALGRPQDLVALLFAQGVPG
ncbi:MAG TPA: 3-hydroxyacyl-CoA dehydrogenase, partial [Rhodobacterales bacterium]|nr:3-hydroxyacyl-CoA dehydrogenase [Rhodobacterales bacterium]